MYRTLRILGVRITPMTIRQMNCAITEAIGAGHRLMIVSQNLHSLYLVHRLPKLRLLQESATYVRIDGMPLVWFARLLGHDVRRHHRTGWMDWIDPFMTEAQRSTWRIFYVGSKPAVMAKALEILRDKYPRLEITGVHGYFDVSAGSVESTSVLEGIRESGADIVLVGMGMPRQEAWLLDNLDSLDAPVLLTCGAAMDYVAGAQPRPPRWMGQLGVEWLHRLAADPKRMWFRYLVEPWFAVRLFVGEYTRQLFKQSKDEA